MNRLHLHPWALALALACPAFAFGQSGADLIPEDATFALAINSVAGVRDKGEKFVKDHGLNVGKHRPSALFKMLFEALEIKKGVDEKGAAALVLPNLKKLGVEELKAELSVLFLPYLAIPVKDVKEIASNFGLKADDLKGGKVHTHNGKVIMLKGKHLYLAMGKKPLSLVPSVKPLTGVLNAAQKEALAKSDLAMHLGAEALGAMFGKALDEAEKHLRRKDEKDDTQSKALIDALRELRFVVGGLDLDSRKINIIATFKTGKDGAAAKKFLTKLRAGPGTSDIIGLPAGKPLAIFAAKGDGTSNVAMARTLVNLLFDQARIDKFLPGEERPAFVASLEKMYRELKGSRIAAYDIDEDEKLGRSAIVGILDIGDTKKHLAEMPSVVKRLNSVLEKAAKGTDTKPMVFSYEGKAGKLDGLEVNLLRVKAPDMPAREKKALVDLLGTEWDRVRIVVVGKKVVFLAGSKVALLKEAVANLKKGAKGLAEDKTVAGGLGRLSKDRKLEIHLNLQGIELHRRGGTGRFRGLTSLALTVEEDRLQLEIAASESEVKPFAALIGLADK
jgi:hypothetical protein